MKKNLLIAFIFGLLINSSNLFAQDYSAIYLTSKNYYSYGQTSPSPPLPRSGTVHPFNFEHLVLAEKIDSFIVSNNDTIFYPFRSFLFPKENRLGTNSTPTFDTSWMGQSIIKNSDSTIFYNWENEKIVLKSKLIINKNWVLYTYPNLTKIEANVTSIDTTSINGILDSVADISLRIKNSNGKYTPIQKNILISKSHGILKGFIWSNLPDMSLPQIEYIPYQKLTIGEVYDFNVGDEFHKAKYYSWHANTFPVVERIVSKNVINSDSIVYIKLEISYRTGNPVSRLVTIEVDSLNHIINNNVPTETQLQFRSYLGSGSGEPITLHIGTNEYNNRRRETSYMSQYITYDSTLNSISQWGTGFDHSKLIHYIKGCGRYYSNYQGNAHNGGSHNGEYLVYFKKGNETWGTPHTVVGIGGINTINKLNFYPNPSSEIIHISEIITDQKAIITIKNMEGKVVKTESAFQLKQLNISDLANGFYLIELRNRNQVKTNKLIISR